MSMVARTNPGPPGTTSPIPMMVIPVFQRAHSLPDVVLRIELRLARIRLPGRVTNSSCLLHTATGAVAHVTAKAGSVAAGTAGGWSHQTLWPMFRHP